MKKIQIELIKFFKKIELEYNIDNTFNELKKIIQKNIYDSENMKDLQKEIQNDLQDHNIGFNNTFDCFQFLQKNDCKLETTNKIYKHLDKNIDLDIFQLCFIIKKALLVTTLNKIIELYQTQNNK